MSQLSVFMIESPCCMAWCRTCEVSWWRFVTLF